MPTLPAPLVRRLRCAALVAAGKPEAARTFARADQLWKERIAEIDEVLEPIIGKGKSGEDILSAVEGMAGGKRGGVARLQRMLATLPTEEKGDVTATVINRLGRARNSAQRAHHGGLSVRRARHLAAALRRSARRSSTDARNRAGG